MKKRIVKVDIHWADDDGNALPPQSFLFQGGDGQVEDIQVDHRHPGPSLCDLHIRGALGRSPQLSPALWDQWREQFVAWAPKEVATGFTEADYWAAKAFGLAMGYLREDTPATGG